MRKLKWYNEAKNSCKHTKVLFRYTGDKILQKTKKSTHSFIATNNSMKVHTQQLHLQWRF